MCVVDHKQRNDIDEQNDQPIRYFAVASLERSDKRARNRVILIKFSTSHQGLAANTNRILFLFVLCRFSLMLLLL